MAKTHRGKALWNLPAHGRGTCPICKAARIKVLYNRTAPDGAEVKVCKRCRRKPFPAVEPTKVEEMLQELELA
jgi:hypothetical protein